MKPEAFKISVLLFVLTMIFSSCHEEESYLVFEDPDKYRLSKVFRFSDSSASQLTGEIAYEYDKDGNMIKESFYEYMRTKILVHYREYEYSGNKKIKEKSYSGEAGNLTLGWYAEYTYADGKLIKEETYNYSGLAHSRHYEYDERGNLIREYNYDPDYGISRGMKYVYDNQNKLIMEETFTSDPLDTDYIKHIYYKGMEVKLEYYDVNWDLIRYEEKVYDGRYKLLTQELRYDKDGKQVMKYQHFYDEWGNLTETVINDECSMFKRKYSGKFLIEEILYWYHEYGYHGTGQMPENGMSRYEYEKI